MKNEGDMRLFIADDSELILERLSVLISEINNVEIVGHARTVPGAISAIQELKPDLVVLDIRMPGGSGIDVLDNVKCSGLDSTVIMLTNYPYPEYKKRCMDAGAEFFFDKSTEFESAIEVIKRLASQQTYEDSKNSYSKEVLK
jgi:DNA-binding NarL/FixJ family response regulator